MKINKRIKISFQNCYIWVVSSGTKTQIKKLLITNFVYHIPALIAQERGFGHRKHSLCTWIS